MKTISRHPKIYSHTAFVGMFPFTYRDADGEIKAIQVADLRDLHVIVRTHGTGKVVSDFLFAAGQGNCVLVDFYKGLPVGGYDVTITGVLYSRPLRVMWSAPAFEIVAAVENVTYNEFAAADMVLMEECVMVLSQPIP